MQTENETSHIHPARRVQGLKPSAAFQALQKADALKENRERYCQSLHR